MTAPKHPIGDEQPFTDEEHRTVEAALQRLEASTPEPPPLILPSEDELLSQIFEPDHE